MSVFGGDSWAREAQQRKRRVDELMLPPSDAFYRKLAGGKYACLVCPSNPILDTPLMLAVHNKGPRHIAAESRLKERELSREELNKRIALSSCSDSISGSANSNDQLKNPGNHQKPLLEQTRQAILETTCNRLNDLNAKKNWCNKEPNGSNFCLPNTSKLSHAPIYTVEPSQSIEIDGPNSSKSILENNEVVREMLADWHMQLRRRQEKGLKFKAAGWKRDCHGKWYRDENVEFDSDEEDPNVVLD